MELFLAGVFALMSSSQDLPLLPDPPLPAPAPPRSVEYICILIDEPAPLMCAEPFPAIPGLSILKPCPDWIAKIVADADAL